MYTSVPNEDDEVIDINVSLSTQQTVRMNDNKNKYYQERFTAVQGIEKTMHDLASMFNKMTQVVYEQRSMIEK
jgi:hypothetical protein